MCKIFLLLMVICSRRVCSIRKSVAVTAPTDYFFLNNMQFGTTEYNYRTELLIFTSSFIINTLCYQNS